MFSFPLWLSADTALDNNIYTQFITIDQKTFCLVYLFVCLVGGQGEQIEDVNTYVTRRDDHTFSWRSITESLAQNNSLL